jgi:hypothetical protein
MKDEHKMYDAGEFPCLINKIPCFLEEQGILFNPLALFDKNHKNQA